MNIIFNNIIKITAIVIGILIVVVLLLQITGFKLNIESLTFNEDKCKAQMDKTPDDQLGRLGKADKLSGWQELCSRPSLFINKNKK